MSKLEFVATKIKTLVYRWFCSKCQKTTIEKDIRSGTDLVAEDVYPTHTPASKRCPDCGDWASFNNAKIVER